MAECTCTRTIVRYPPGQIPAWEFLQTVRDRDCPLHGNAVLFSPAGNARAAARLFADRRLPWVKALIDTGRFLDET